MSLREVFEMHQDKIKPGINSYEAVDPLTGQVGKPVKHLPYSKILCCPILYLIAIAYRTNCVLFLTIHKNGNIILCIINYKRQSVWMSSWSPFVVQIWK